MKRGKEGQEREGGPREGGEMGKERGGGVGEEREEGENKGRGAHLFPNSHPLLHSSPSSPLITHL